VLSRFLRQFINSFGIFFRTIRAFFTRKLTGLGARLRRFSNFSRYAGKVASSSFQGAASAMKKPSRREDYIETSRLYIAKSFLILLLAGLAVAGLLFYFFVWPFLVSHFFTTRLYQEDPRLADWSGRVIVCYDEEKKQPKYSGTLEDGVLQGKGKEYDQDGILTYDGNFLDGLYDGKGVQYEKGVLVYQGRFQSGVYEGTGELYEGGLLVYSGSFSAGKPSGTGTAYRRGSMCYQGMFLAGEYSGEGVSYYPSGQVEYKGAFSQGLREGTGTLYYENGERAYAGAFSAGLREGEGTAYREDGSVLYKGSFAQDLYEGSGALYLENGDSVQSEFRAGAAGGSIQWYRGGTLWYEGEAEDITPQGFGTIYGRDGKIIYSGQMDEGTLDASWLLTLTSEEFRTACGDAVLTEQDRTNGFVIENGALGLSALCSFQREDQESLVYRAWLETEELPLSPWDRQREGGLPDSAGSGGASGGSLSQAQERLEGLTDALSQIGGGDGGSVDRGGVERLLGLTVTAEDAKSLTDALIDFLVYQKMSEALEANQPLLIRRLADEQTALERGTGVQAAVDAAQDRVDELDLRLAEYKKEQEEARAEVKKLTTLDPEDYELKPLLLLFDPAELDVSALYDQALEYAKQVAAGRYVVDTEVLEEQVRTNVLSLSTFYENYRTAVQRLERLEQTLEEQSLGYAKGTVSKAALYDAQCSVGEAAAAVYQALGSFARTANQLNDLSGGWVSQQYDWLPETYGAIYQGEVKRGEEAAAALEEERRQREEAAAEALQESEQEGGT